MQVCTIKKFGQTCSTKIRCEIGQLWCEIGFTIIVERMLESFWFLHLFALRWYGLWSCININAICHIYAKLSYDTQYGQYGTSNKISTRVNGILRADPSTRANSFGACICNATNQRKVLIQKRVPPPPWYGVEGPPNCFVGDIYFMK